MQRSVCSSPPTAAAAVAAATQAQPTFRYRKRSRTVMDTAEEAYLRVDIPCGAGAACAACPPTAPALALLEPADAAVGGGGAGAPPPHLLLPDAAALAECLEVLELPQLRNAVLLSSELRQVGWGWGWGRQPGACGHMLRCRARCVCSLLAAVRALAYRALPLRASTLSPAPPPAAGRRRQHAALAAPARALH